MQRTREGTVGSNPTRSAATLSLETEGPGADDLVCFELLDLRIREAEQA